MAVLEAALERALQGSGQVVGIVADPGVGKSRLCFEFVERCRARGIFVNEGALPRAREDDPIRTDPRALALVLRDYRERFQRRGEKEDRRHPASARPWTSRELAARLRVSRGNGPGAPGAADGSRGERAPAVRAPSRRDAATDRAAAVDHPDRRSPLDRSGERRLGRAARRADQRQAVSAAAELPSRIRRLVDEAVLVSAASASAAWARGGRGAAPAASSGTIRAWRRSGSGSASGPGGIPSSSRRWCSRSRSREVSRGRRATTACAAADRDDRNSHHCSGGACGPDRPAPAEGEATPADGGGDRQSLPRSRSSGGSRRSPAPSFALRLPPSSRRSWFSRRLSTRRRSTRSNIR